MYAIRTDDLCTLRLPRTTEIVESETSGDNSESYVDYEHHELPGHAGRFIAPTLQWMRTDPPNRVHVGSIQLRDPDGEAENLPPLSWYLDHEAPWPR